MKMTSLSTEMTISGFLGSPETDSTLPETYCIQWPRWMTMFPVIGVCQYLTMLSFAVNLSLCLIPGFAVRT